MDVLIQNARIIDGTGKPAYTGSVGIEDGKILLSGLTGPAAQVIDAKGRCLAPGLGHHGPGHLRLHQG